MKMFRNDSPDIKPQHCLTYLLHQLDTPVWTVPCRYPHVTTLRLIIDKESSTPVLAIEDGGLHAAEALILARYMMFTQVYFQHTRRAYDKHLALAMKTLLEEKYGPDSSVFPEPKTTEGILEYLKWDDWYVLGQISTGKGGPHAEILRSREHFRRIYETGETPTNDELDQIKIIQEKFEEKIGFTDMARNSFYKFESADIPIYLSQSEEIVKLSEVSSVIKGLRSINQYRIYAPVEDRKYIENEIKKLKD